jgi:DNA-binding transcriptional regulator YhcF (GntR family)
MNPKDENEPIEETKTAYCFYCKEDKPEYYTKKLFKISISCCEDCARKAKEEGVVNTFTESMFGSVTQEDADNTTEKIKKMSKKKKDKLTKKLQKMGYTEEQIEEAITKIKKGIKI